MPTAKPIFAAAALLLLSCTPRAPNVPAQQCLDEAWRAFSLEDFDQAQRSFQAAMDQHPPKELGLNALYGLAMVASLGHHADHSPGKAKLLQQLIEEDDSPGRPMAAWAALALVRDQALDADAPPERLLAAYTQVGRDYPGTPAAEEALVHRQRLLVESMQPDNARTAVAEITVHLAAHADSPLKTDFLTLLSAAHQTLHQYPEALQAAIAALNAKTLNAPTANNILEIYRIGLMAQFDVGDFATARAYYQRFLAEYPRDQRAFNAQLLLKHLDATEAALKQGKPVPQLSDIATGQGDAP